MVLGGGTIADLIDREQRGTAMVVWMMGPSKGHGSSHCCNVSNYYDSAWTLRWTNNRWLLNRGKRVEMEFLVCRNRRRSHPHRRRQNAGS